jgi:hypothetical protein
MPDGSNAERRRHRIRVAGIDAPDKRPSSYRVHAVSLGLATRIAGLTYIDFVEELGRLGILLIDHNPSELTQEVARLG